MNESTGEKTNPLNIDPEEKKRVVNEINILKAEKTKKEVDLSKLKNLLNKTQIQLAGLENDDLKFNFADVNNSTNSKTSFYYLRILRSYKIHFQYVR
jgi:hypothetical protein